MLSYRHAFHAGNFADLLKHIVQIEIIDYLRQKNKPFDYIDTHAGAGLYRLGGEMADKNKEYESGIGHFWHMDKPPHSVRPLLDLVTKCQSKYGRGNEMLYPGSPLIAAQMLRQGDKAWLHELHPNDYKRVEDLFARHKDVYVRRQDGFEGMIGLLPCASRRALVLIDPSYEIKSDYEKIVNMVQKAHRKMPNAIFAIWYPVVERARIDAVRAGFEASGIRNIQQFELGIRADTQTHGMTSAGMIVINPPWTLAKKMEEALPDLARAVTEDGDLHYRCEEWVGE